MRNHRNRIEKLENGKQQGIFIAIGAGPDRYETNNGTMSREEVDRIEKSGQRMTRIDGDWRGV